MKRDYETPEFNVSFLLLTDQLLRQSAEAPGTDADGDDGNFDGNDEDFDW